MTENLIFDAKYILDDKYIGYNIQLDLYNGESKIPKYDLQEMEILTDDTHKLATIREKLNVIETEKNFQNYLRAYLLAYRKHQKFSL